MNNLLIFVSLFLILSGLCEGDKNYNKYSKDANEPAKEEKLPNDKPFRMLKLNLLWEKAEKVNFVFFITDFY